MSNNESTPEACTQWQVSVAGRVYGPLDLAALKSMAQAGQLTPVALVCAVGTTQWRLISTVPEMAGLPFVAATTAGPASPAASRPRWAPIVLVAAVVLLVGGYWGYRTGFIGLDLWPWYRPMLGERRIQSERWLKPPQSIGIYILDQGKLRDFPRDGTVPVVSPEVEFMQFAVPWEVVRHASFSISYPDPTAKDQYAPGCINMPFRKKGDVMRFIPDRLLEPGYYLINQFGAFTVEPELYAQHLREHILASFKAGQWDDGEICARHLLSISGKMTSQTETLRREWAGSILKYAPGDPNLPSTHVLTLLNDSISWSPEVRPQAAQAALTLAKSLMQKPNALDQAFCSLDFAVQFSSTTLAQALSLGWTELSRRLGDLPKLGRYNFMGMCSFFERRGFPEEAKTQQVYQLVQALMAYDRGELGRAMPLLRELANATSESTATLIARQIVNPPPQGKILVSRPPVMVRNRMNEEIIRLDLSSVQVGDKEVEVVFMASNPSPRQQLLAYAENGSEPNSGGTGQPIFIVDDNKTKLESRYGLVGGTMVAAPSGNVRGIQLDPGEKTQLVARFPLPSPGAKSFTFVSPEYGRQGAWGWRDLPYRSGLFETPIDMLPYTPIKLTQPAAAEAKAAKAEKSQPTTTPEPTLKPKTTNAGSPARKTKAARPTPTPEPTETPAPTPEPQAPQANRDRNTVPAQSTPALSLQKSRATVNPAQAQATALRRDAQAARQRCQNQLRRSPLKVALFASGGSQVQAAEEAYSAGNYTGASLYFQQAIAIYKRITNQ